MAVPIKIENADIDGEGGSIHNATVTGDATLQRDPGDAHPEHPILLPPPSTGGDQFWLLVYCANPPPGHFEWVSFSPGDPPERPQPVPPEPPTTTPPGEKPFPPDGGWGFKEPWGWVYWPGPGGAGPKKR
jgi:hypothetical protein